MRVAPYLGGDYMAKTKRKKLTEKLDELCKWIVRARDENLCQKCGKWVEGTDAHTSHVVDKGNGASGRRFDLLNLKLLCKSHHLYWWHREITEASEWFKGKWPVRDKYLDKYRGGKLAKITDIEMVELVEVYKQKLKELKDL